MRSRGQGQGLDLRGQVQGQGLQNLSSRTPPLTKTTTTLLGMKRIFKIIKNRPRERVLERTVKTAFVARH